MWSRDLFAIIVIGGGNPSQRCDSKVSCYNAFSFDMALSHMMPTLCRTTWRMLTFRDGPNHLPYSTSLMMYLLLANVALRGVLFGIADPVMWAVIIMNLALLALFLHVLVRWRKVPNRFLQAYCALLILLVCEVVFYRLASVIAFGNGHIYWVLSFLILLWTMMVMTHIVQVTVRINVMVAVFLVFLYEAVHFVFLVYLANVAAGWLGS